MALDDILLITGGRRKLGISEERLRAVIPPLREYIAFWREYPDLFIDFMAGPNSNFKLYFYQRVFLRAAIRHKYVYAVFPRAYSKSFLSIMILFCRCILYPGSKLFVTSGGKEQAAGILKEKSTEICELIPSLSREVMFDAKKTTQTKDYVKMEFKNGSYFDNIAANEKSRGKRRHGGVIEECVGVDGEILSTVIIPTMNVSRRCMDGTTQQDETLNKSQIYVTTAGWKGTFAYEKLVQLLVWQLIKPDRAFIMGGTYRVPVLNGLLDKTFLKDLKMDSTFNEASFGREYESLWSGTMEDAFFNSERFDRCRRLLQPEVEYSGRSNKGAYYIISVDVGRKDCDSVACVFKVTPQPTGTSIKSLVNIFVLTAAHFEEQAIKIKQLYFKYNARRVVIDANGLGIGLIDYMVKPQIDECGETLVDFGIYNDKDNSYRKYRSKECEIDAVYLIKANVEINSDAHAECQTQMAAGKIWFLIDEKDAKQKLLSTKMGAKMTIDQRAEYLKPFTLTSILKDEMMNLREEKDGTHIILKPANKKIKKDKFSAFEYGLYYIKQEEDSRRKRRGSLKDAVFCTSR